jgi:dihydroorotase
LEEKQSGEALNAPSGVPGVETMLSLLMSVANGHWPNHQSLIPNPQLTYSDIQRLCFENPNRIFNLGKSGDEKIMIDPKAEWIIKGSELHSKCGWTPFEGWVVRGKIVQQ